MLLHDDNVESIPAETVREAFGNCSPSTIFKQCGTPHKIKAFMTEKLHRVAPEKVTIGTIPIWSKTGQLIDKDCYAYIPPFMRSLKLCLNNRDILH